MLQHYQESGEYVRFNNVMCAFLPDDEERVIALTEISPGKGYTLDYVESAKFIYRSFQRCHFSKGAA
ncbi:DUF5081 family protein [Bacillus licheniformis]|nr:DUF5081 family protein [Bacillus licheniformis]